MAPPPRGLARLAPVALILIGVGLVFGRIVGFEFLQWDDDFNVTGNVFLRPVTAAGLARFWQDSFLNLYVPLAYSFFALEAWISQVLAGPADPAALDPAIFHAGSLVLHALASLLVYALLARLLPHRGAAAFGALFFALHPLQVESVAWVSETRGLLGGCFSFLTLLLYLRASPDPVSADGRDPAARGRRWSLAAALLCFALALLSKPSAVTLPAVAFAIEVLWRRRPWRSVALETSPAFLLAVVVVVATKHMQPDSGMLFLAPVWSRPFIAADALAFYAWKLLLPWNLAPDYGRTPEVLLEGSAYWLTWLVPLAAFAACAFARGRRAWLTCGLVAAFGLAPVLGLVPFRNHMLSTVADRNFYFTMLRPALAVALLLSHGVASARLPLLRTVPAAAVLVILGGLSAQQAGRWRDTETLFEHTVAVNPSSFSAHNNLGLLFEAQGRLDEAVDHYHAAIEALPEEEQTAKVHNNLAVLLDTQGRRAEAISNYQRAVELYPPYGKAHANLAELLAREGRTLEAIEHYEAAIEVTADFLPAITNLAALLHQVGRLDEALEAIDRVLAVDAHFAQAHYTLGVILVGEGRSDEARVHLREVLRAHPDFELAAELLRQLDGEGATSDAR